MTLWLSFSLFKLLSHFFDTAVAKVTDVNSGFEQHTYLACRWLPAEREEAEGGIHTRRDLTRTTNRTEAGRSRYLHFHLTDTLDADYKMSFLSSCKKSASLSIAAKLIVEVKNNAANSSVCGVFMTD